jgi:hypothetical protein
MYVLNRQLTDAERERVTEQAQAFYNDVKAAGNSHHESQRKWGIEAEAFAVHLADMRPAVGAAKYIVDKANHPSVKLESGSAHLEFAIPPQVLTQGSVNWAALSLRSAIDSVRQPLRSRNLGLLMMGMLPRLKEGDTRDDTFLINDPLYTVDRDYWREHEPDDEPYTLKHRDGSTFDLHDSTNAWGAISALHIHLQAKNWDDAVQLYNASLRLTPLFIALSANAGILNGKRLTKKDVRLNVASFDPCIEYDPDFNIGVVTEPIAHIDDFFKGLLLKTKPVFAFTNNGDYTRDSDDEFWQAMTDRDAFESIREISFPSQLLRFDEVDPRILRLEYRPLSAQLTMTETVGMSILYSLAMDYFAAHPEKLAALDSDKLLRDVYGAMQHGMQATLHCWDGKGKEKAYKQGSELVEIAIEHGLATGQLDPIGRGYLNVMRSYADRQVCPTDRIVRRMESQGELVALQDHLEVR